MTFRIGRIRSVDIALFASGALQLHLLFSPGMFKGCGSGPLSLSSATSLMASGSFTRWIVLVSGVMAVLVIPFELIRRSPASALWLTVVLTPLGLVNLVSLLALFSFAPAGSDWGGCAQRHGSFYVLVANGFVLIALAVASIRSETRGLSPDESSVPTALSLDGTRIDA